MSKFSMRVATNVTIQTIWRRGHGQLRHGVPASTCKPQGGWRNPLQGQEQSPGASQRLTRSTRLDFQSTRRSLNCLNMPLRLTMMMAAKMA